MASEQIVSGFNLTRNIPDESWWSYAFATGSLAASLIKSEPCCYPAAPLLTALGGLKLISLLVRVTLVRVQLALLGKSWARAQSLSPTPNVLLCDAGHVTAVPELIYHSNCGWRMGTAEEQRKAALDSPFSRYILNNLCQGCSLNGEWRPCVPRLQMGKKTARHAPLRISSEIDGKSLRRTREAMGILSCMSEICVLFSWLKHKNNKGPDNPFFLLLTKAKLCWTLYE